MGTITLRVNDDELVALKETAAAAGEDLSHYVRKAFRARRAGALISERVEELAQRLTLTTLKPHKCNVLIFRLPMSEYRSVNPSIIAEECQAHLAAYGVRATLIIPDTWQVDFAEQESQPDDDDEPEEGETDHAAG